MENKTITLNATQKRVLFNGRTLNGRFRRGFWDVSQLKQTSGCPDNIPTDAVKILYANGAIAFYITDKKTIVKNTQNTSDDVDAIVAYIQAMNHLDAQAITTADLGKATRAGHSKNLDLLML